ncbi:MAG TPA: LptA/OstA family protein [Terracidiphilus sp.]|nr:LptA/OstA family protein [Terracidiphilus sp.]
MRLTIERLRTILLLAGILLVVVLGVFLAIGKWRSPLSRKDLPKRLGFDVEQESNGFTFSHALGAHSQFKIHASKLIQLKQGNRVLLHDVQIDLYGADGSQVDRIEGGEFEYDQQAGIAKATGPVEIRVTRPSVAPAVAAKASARLGGNTRDNPLTAVNASSGEIDVKTSGLVFNQNTGVAETNQQVQFSTVQGSGSAIGASYDSQKGTLTLDDAVQLNTHRGNQDVELHAQRAVLERGDQMCQLEGARAAYPGGEARATSATIAFREDGSAERLDATGEFTLATKTGGRLAAPTGWLQFGDHNQPKEGFLSDGVTIDSNNDRRKMHGSSETLALAFSNGGLLHSAHLEGGVKIESAEEMLSSGVQEEAKRTWSSPVADIEFRDAGGGRIELASIQGTDGVKVTGEDQRGNGGWTPSALSANEVTGRFGAGSVLAELIGIGNAHMEQTTANGARQSVSGDRLDAHFASPSVAEKTGVAGRSNRNPSTQIQSATVDGHVVLVQQPAQKAGTPGAAVLRATADRAVDEGAGNWLHLRGEPRVVDGGLELAAEKIDVSRTNGDALALGNVKATWFGNEEGKPADGRTAEAVPMVGGNGPTHAIADKAELHQSSGEANFEGHARLWQQANSVAAPEIVLNRTKQTLDARTDNAAEPVRVVLLSAAGTERGEKAKAHMPRLIRLRGGELQYSSTDREATMKSGVEENVVTETSDSTIVSNQMELLLASVEGAGVRSESAAEVKSITATGDVVVRSEDRIGKGEKLVYSGRSNEYTLTGTSAVPPRLTDPTRGSVTGAALIFNSRDDSVRIEGGGGNSTVSSARKQ